MMDMTIFSERFANAFSDIARSAGMSVNVCNKTSDFANLLRTCHKHIVINADSKEAVAELSKLLFQINAILGTNLVQTLQVIIPAEGKHFVSQIVAPDITQFFYVEQTATQEIIREALALRFSDQELYGERKETRAPIVGTSPDKVKDSKLSEFVSTVLMYTAQEHTAAALKHAQDQLELEKKQKMEELDRSIPDGVDSSYYTQLEKRKELIAMTYDMGKANVAVQVIPDILKETSTETKRELNSVATEVKNVIRLKEVHEDEVLIKEKLMAVRKKVTAVDSLMKDSKEKLTVVKENLLSLSIPQKDQLLELIEVTGDYIDKKTATDLIEMSSTLTSQRNSLIANWKTSVEEVVDLNNKIQVGYQDVIRGYESVVHDTVSLIDKLKSSAKIEVSADNKMAANLMMVYGTAQSGATNYALCTAYAASEKGRACVIDLKTDNPQLHYYMKSSLELATLFNKPLAQVKADIETALSAGTLLAITNRSASMLVNANPIAEVVAFISDLLFIITEMDIPTYVITNRKDCEIKKWLDNNVIVSTIVTDTNIGKTAELSNLVRLSLLNNSIKHRTLIVNKVHTLSVEKFLVQVGIQTNRFLVKTIPFLPIDLFKVQSSVYAATNSWGW